MPRVSVIMPVYNQNKSFLKDAIESVLNQSYTDFELILIDDGSDLQQCQRMLSEYAIHEKIKLVKNPANFGVIKSRNIGIEHAEGEFVAILDSDDIAGQTRLEEQVSFLDKNLDYGLCASWAYIIDEQGKTIGKKQSPIDYSSIKKKIISQNFITHSTCLFRKKIIENIGMYDESFLKTEDYDFLLRVISKYKIEILPKYLCSYRINSNGVSLTNNKFQEKYSIKVKLKAIKNYGYPKCDYIKVLPAVFIYYLMPTSFKQFILKRIWKNS